MNQFGLRLPAASGTGTVYCTPKLSSAGCSTCIGVSGSSAPVSGAADYFVAATDVQGFKNGLLLVSLSGAANIPFSGGVLCMNPPTKRGALQSSGGTLPSSCDGSLATLVNDGQLIPLGLDPGAGTSAWYQYWYRDPGNGAGTLGSALSNALEISFE